METDRDNVLNHTDLHMVYIHLHGGKYHDLLQSSTIHRHLSSAGLVAGTMSQVKIEVQHDASFASVKFNEATI